MTVSDYCYKYPLQNQNTFPKLEHRIQCYYHQPLSLSLLYYPPRARHSLLRLFIAMEITAQAAVKVTQG